MQIKGNDLATHLRNDQLLSAYLVTGADSLLCQEAADLIRAQAKKAGFAREIITVTANFQWQALIDAIDHYDLFADQRLIEIHNPSGRFDAKGLAALSHYFDKKPDDKRLLILTEKLTGNQKKAKWTQLVQKNGAMVTVWPPSRIALPKWIEDRLRRGKLSADRYAIQLLAQFCEGNLSAAQQAIEKLQLMQPELPVSAEVMQAVISDHASFSPFDCVDAALAGQVKRAVRILRGLQATGQETTLLLWALTQQLRTLYSMAQGLAQGQRMVNVLQGQWERRQPILKAALQRLNVATLGACLTDALAVDLVIKGAEPGCPWRSLEQLCLRFAGAMVVTS